MGPKPQPDAPASPDGKDAKTKPMGPTPSAAPLKKTVSSPVPSALRKKETNLSKNKKEDRALGNKISHHQRRRVESRPVLHLPPWLKYYEVISYVLFGFEFAWSLAYLCYVSVIFFDKTFHIQYQPVVDLFGYNSYNLQCIFIGFILIGVFAHHVYTRKKLSSGEFYTLMGVLLFFSGVMLYTSVGCFRLYENRTIYVKSPKHPERLREQELNPTEPNEYAWQYAWSTRPTCARHHAKKVRTEIKNNAHENNALRGPAITQNQAGGSNKRQATHWMHSGKTKQEVIDETKPLRRRRQAAAAAAPNETEPAANQSASTVAPAGERDRTRTAEQITYETDCNSTFNSISKQDHRAWMIEMQRTFKCCGPRGQADWEKRVNGVARFCKGNSSCAVPFNRYLADKFYVVAAMQLSMVVLYLLVIFTATMHYIAMKYREEKVTKTYSLLDLRDPPDVVILDDMQAAQMKHMAHELMGVGQVRGVLQASNMRTGRSGKRSLIAKKKDTKTSLLQGGRGRSMLAGDPSNKLHTMDQKHGHGHGHGHGHH